ncbi:hypothetical protein AAGS40_09750 [Paraburkholderia sp. PREW-6R]|uniref:hypothetical protein n=1 Tax=Paraburkholderia sp. PREW-6R TaxID=3141544 RepID=UPI0031F4DAB1
MADILGGEITDDLAKDEGGGHPIIGMQRFKRGFPDACAARVVEQSLQMAARP